MAELHILGTLHHAHSFPSQSLTCKYRLIIGDGWKLIEGDEEGMTQVDVGGNSVGKEKGGMCFWCHPIDVHYATKTISGWPKLQLQVFKQDSYGRNQLYGYGFTHIPTTPGSHILSIPTWRPITSFWDSFTSWWNNSTPALKNVDMVHEPGDRFRLTTVGGGTVVIEIGVLVRGFEGYGVAM